MVKIGVIGYGYWGPNLVRNFMETREATVAAVSDLDGERLGEVQRRYPGVKTTTDYRELLRDPDIDAIAVATPVGTHFDLGMAALQAGKHLWLEKPMTEALRVEGEHFADCIQNKKTPQTDGQLGHRVVRLIEVANSSMRRMGETVFIHREVKA